MNPDLSGAIFTLSLSILVLNYQCVEGARYVRVHKLTPITLTRNYFNPEKQFENEKFEITIMGFISTVFMISFYYYFLFEMVKTIVIYFAVIFVLFIGLSYAYNSAIKLK